MSTDPVPVDYESPAGRRTVASLESTTRRTALSALADAGGPVREAALAWIVAVETAGAPADISETDLREIRLALHHRDLPKLADRDFVTRDRDERVVEATGRGTRVAEEQLATDDGTAGWVRHRETVIVLEAVDTHDDPVSLQTLAETVVETRDARSDQETATIRLHHATLPRLDDAGLVTYDAAARRVDSG